jgi:hypothetical protein
MSGGGTGGTASVGIDALDWFELRRPAPPQELDLVALAEQLTSIVSERVRGDGRVGVAVGSRGIARLPEVVAAVVGALRTAGAKPVLIPAMGSHGGATSNGQIAVLGELGVDAEALGVPIDASMEVTQVGELASGRPVYVGTAALACDAVIPINRVKPHTDFRASVESGLTKMLTIGLGKERGASSLHSAGFSSFAEVLPEAFQIVRTSVHVPFGVALIEDAWHRLHQVAVVPGDEVLQSDEALLKQAWDNFGALPFAEVDVLVLREMGKTVSGAGMDPNVTGRFAGTSLPAPTVVERLVVLDLREDSGGNATGLGVADIVTERLRDKIDWGYTYANALASKLLSAAKLPIVVGTDADAFTTALGSLVGRGAGNARMVAMANTLEVAHLAVSEPLVPSALGAGYVLTGAPKRAIFSSSGCLVRIGDLAFFNEAERSFLPDAAGVDID